MKKVVVMLVLAVALAGMIGIGCGALENMEEQRKIKTKARIDCAAEIQDSLRAKAPTMQKVGNITVTVVDETVLEIYLPVPVGSEGGFERLILPYTSDSLEALGFKRFVLRCAGQDYPVINTYL